MKTEIMLDPYTKFEIEDIDEKTLLVNMYELMGDRWVTFGEPERWDADSFVDYYDIQHYGIQI